MTTARAGGGGGGGGTAAGAPTGWRARLAARQRHEAGGATVVKGATTAQEKEKVPRKQLNVWEALADSSEDEDDSD